MQWSKPFYGIQHLAVPRPYQVTVSDYGTFANLTVFNLQNKPFTSPLVDKYFDTLSEAREQGERWAKNHIN